MGKNMYRVITIVIAVILFASILLKRDINGNSEAFSEKALEMINDTNKKEPSKNDKKKKKNQQNLLLGIYLNYIKVIVIGKKI
ncbi:hypothetical protein LEQ06_04785 [Paraclostridium sp. AKS46]|nr:hypothetical protein [Paraclostridium sp. AKS46]